MPILILSHLYCVVVHVLLLTVLDWTNESTCISFIFLMVNLFPLSATYILHYANMPMQYAAPFNMFKGCKNDIFLDEKNDMFLIFAQKYIVSTHNQNKKI